MTSTSVLLLAMLVGGSLPSGSGGFVRGHIFVSAYEGEACFNGDPERIIEIDPVSGTWSVFADSDDGLCVVSGLRFTPDGSRLLAANWGHLGGSIQAFNPDGSSEIILDASDGLYRPYGSNCLAFDESGDLYVVSADYSRILRFPHGGGGATIFADSSDGIDGRGALEFSPSGDLFYTGVLVGAIIRINPAGQASVFDTPGSIALAFDDRENLFAATGAGVKRYDGPGPDPTTRRLLAGGFINCCEWTAIALSPDRRTLYFAEAALGRVHAVDPDTGASSLIADFSELSFFGIVPVGMAVYVPALAGDMGRDGDLDLEDFAVWSRCWTGNEAIVDDPSCTRADLNGDDYVNSVDFAKFVPAITGP